MCRSCRRREQRIVRVTALGDWSRQDFAGDDLLQELGPTEIVPANGLL